MAEKKEITKVDIPLKIGDSAVFEKTITETDVVLFGGLTGDYSQMHFNEEYMKKTMYGTRIAHGILTFAIGCFFCNSGTGKITGSFRILRIR